MKLVVITLERQSGDEHAVIAEMFARGLERLHVRKPYASRDELARWLERIPAQWRDRLVLHQHHELASAFGVGGLHWPEKECHVLRDTSYRSRSCHDLDGLRSATGVYDSVFFGPVFPSISKPGYIPDPVLLEGVSAWLHARTDASRRTTVIAIGGVTSERVRRAAELGFDGVAVLGAIWKASDRVAAFEVLLAVCRSEFIRDSATDRDVTRIADESAPTAAVGRILS